MAMEQAVVIFALIHLVIMDVSHITAPHAWIDFFVRLRDQGEKGVIVVGFISLGFGSIIAAFHQVWSGWPLVLTLLGWAQVLKAGIYFIRPAFGLKKLERVSPERPQDFVIAGAGLLAIAAMVAVPLFR
jgi:hypothetical protein